MIGVPVSAFLTELPVQLAEATLTRHSVVFMREGAERTPAAVDPATGARIATYPRATRVFAWILFVVGFVGGTIVAIHLPWRMSAAIFGPLLAAGVAMVVEFSWVRIEWTDEAISIASPWKRRRSLPWDEIVEVRYSRLLQWYVVRGRGGVTIRVSDTLGGIRQLLEEMRRRGLRFTPLAR